MTEIENNYLHYNPNSKENLAECIKKGIRVIPVEIEEQMKEAYLDYSMSVIIGRALPDLRDGLKPVHRRILYSMNESGWRSDRPTVKCAKVVGDVIANYHPHGDKAVYDSLVRMAQPFSLRMPLIYGQGNFGSIDGDNPAAYRYTEAKLQKLGEELLRDIDKNTIDFSPNFDDTKKQPDILPASFPNLLVNGSSGIAVGMATNIPSHNLQETIQAVIAVLNNPDISIAEIVKILPGPDFPTGGIITNSKGILSAYSTGKGSIGIRSVANIEKDTKDREKIVVTEIPYQVNKRELLKNIGLLVSQKKINGIREILDLSDRNGIRIEFSIKRDHSGQVVLNQLYKMTNLQISYSIILLATLDNKPKIFSIKEILNHYANHRKNVVVRRTKFDLNNAEKRKHILEGLKIAQENIEEIVALIKKSNNSQEAKENLMKRFDLSLQQATVICEMQLQRLTSIEVKKIIEELKQLEILIIDLKDILEKPERVKAIVCEELQEISNKYKSDRRTNIDVNSDDRDDFEMEDFIENKEVILQITQDNFVKRLPFDTFKMQKRGGYGVQGTSKKEDSIKIMKVVKNHDTVLMFSNIGKVYSIRAYNLPMVTKDSKGKHLINLLNLNEKEYISSIFSYSQEDLDIELLLITKLGFIKKSRISDFKNVRKIGIIGIGLRETDELLFVKKIKPNQQVFIASKLGLGLFINSSKLRIQQGRNAKGVNAMNLQKNDEIIGCCLSKKDNSIFSISELGYGKRMSFGNFSEKGRGGKGMIYTKVNEKSGKAIAVDSVEIEDEILITSQFGKTIRIGSNEINEIGRNTIGVKVVRLKENDKVENIVILKKSKLKEEEEN